MTKKWAVLRNRVRSRLGAAERVEVHREELIEGGVLKRLRELSEEHPEIEDEYQRLKSQE